MNASQRRIVARFRRLTKDARAAGLTLAVDAEAWGLRFIPNETPQDDLRGAGHLVGFPVENARGDWEAGETVQVDSACGTPVRKCTVM